jgi:hypothetical protein
MQKELLSLLADGDRFGIEDGRIARALERKGLAKFIPESRAAFITAKGLSVHRKLSQGAAS